MHRLLLTPVFVLGVILGLFAQTFKGKVLDASNNQPIAFAEIHIDDLNVSFTSDTLGFFQYFGPIPSNAHLVVNAVGYESKNVTVSVLNQEISVSLVKNHIELNEITIAYGKDSLSLIKNTTGEYFQLNELTSIAATTMGEVISKVPGVYVSSTGIGSSKPVIRGMQGMRIVTLLNGMRIDNQQWGSDHGMGITELGIGSFELIKGPASLLYGPDAIGGAINYVDEPFAKQGENQIGFKNQVESNTLGTSNHFWFKTSRSNMRLNVAANYSNHADYKLTNGLMAFNTRFFEQGLKVVYGFIFKRWVMNIRYNYASSSIGIPGESDDSLLVANKYMTMQQVRTTTFPVQQFDNHYLTWENKWFIQSNQLNLLVGATSNQLSEFEEAHAPASLQMKLLNFPYTLKLIAPITKTCKLTTGVQGTFQSNINAKSASEEIIPNSWNLDNGFFITSEFLKNNWVLQAGARGDLRVLKSMEYVKESDWFHENYTGFNFSLSSLYKASNTTLFKSSITSGFRPPHLSELLVNGIHEGALRYEIGNSNLSPEHATQYELAYEYHSEHLSFIINPFLNQYKGFISLQPLDSTISGLPVFKYAQFGNTQVKGIEFSWHFHPHFAHWLHVENNFTYLRATIDNGTNLALMPQPRMMSMLKVTAKQRDKFGFSELALQHTVSFAQEKVAFNESKSPRYQVLNIAVNFSNPLKKSLAVSFGIKNCLNEHYTDHLSRLKNIGMSSPGRNYYVSFKYCMNYKNSKSNKLNDSKKNY